MERGGGKEEVGGGNEEKRRVGNHSQDGKKLNLDFPIISEVKHLSVSLWALHIF